MWHLEYRMVMLAVALAQAGGTHDSRVRDAALQMHEISDR
jgi:hypothetical protein